MVARDGIEPLKALKTGKLLTLHGPKNPENLQKPVSQYIGGTRKRSIPRLHSTALADKDIRSKTQVNIFTRNLC